MTDGRGRQTCFDGGRELRNIKAFSKRVKPIKCMGPKRSRGLTGRVGGNGCMVRRLRVFVFR